MLEKFYDVVSNFKNVAVARGVERYILKKFGIEVSIDIEEFYIDMASEKDKVFLTLNVDAEAKKEDIINLIKGKKEIKNED